MTPTAQATACSVVVPVGGQKPSTKSAARAVAASSAEDIIEPQEYATLGAIWRAGKRPHVRVGVKVFPFLHLVAKVRELVSVTDWRGCTHAPCANTGWMKVLAACGCVEGVLPRGCTEWEWQVTDLGRELVRDFEQQVRANDVGSHRKRPTTQA
jgi:hypothetical protein